MLERPEECQAGADRRGLHNAAAGMEVTHDCLLG
jgi:hypothetical protein